MPTGVNPGDDALATSTAGAATSNHTGTQVTTEALATAAGADYSFTLTNANIIATSLVFVSVGNGSNTTLPVYAHSIQPAAGSVTFKVRNGHASAALNGTLVLNILAV
jgi:hypothetical protein